LSGREYRLGIDQSQDWACLQYGAFVVEGDDNTVDLLVAEGNAYQVAGFENIGHLGRDAVMERESGRRIGALAFPRDRMIEMRVDNNFGESRHRLLRRSLCSPFYPLSPPAFAARLPSWTVAVGSMAAWHLSL
jgi:hypothetical protein